MEVFFILVAQQSFLLDCLTIVHIKEQAMPCIGLGSSKIAAKIQHFLPISKSFLKKNVFFVRFVPFSALEAGEKRRSRADLHPRVPRKSRQAFPMIGSPKPET